ncbi:hypothetical protein [Campylobacter troglodytis]|uniref:hypothetical protein n=1 Tax=Campylobacter troglodytis TaxID=654363 RepID=UPI001159A0D7|nr:hypothetical protein [Campylobacter troglodytis]TQR53275.1 hypothetical protein DMC01_11495 [Campylobacter troglodytis]
MKTKLICALFILFGSYVHLLAKPSTNSFMLNPFSVDNLYLKDKFDFSKKGNIYEKTFIMPLDLWRAWGGYLYVDIFVSFDYEDDLNAVRIEELRTLPIQNAKDFVNRIEIIRSPYTDKIHYMPNYWIPERKEQIMRILEAYQPNQHFKFKITFFPYRNPKAKQEKIIEFPLYFIGSKQKYATYMRAKVKTWRRYYVKIEVLEDANLSKELVPIVIIESTSFK